MDLMGQWDKSITKDGLMGICSREVTYPYIYPIIMMLQHTAQWQIIDETMFRPINNNK